MTAADDLGDGPPTGARAIAEAVRARRASATEVLESFTARVEADNERLNALVALRLDGARAEARAVDEALDRGDAVGPLAGVPFTVKDVLATADLPTTCGSRALGEHRTRLDATSVARLRDAGAILIGKSNCPEFAFGVDTDNPCYGRTANPLGPFIPGGSSGGEASAVAAGFSALGIGTDFGGSVRWPAQCAGLVGLRPTVGRVPTTGTLPAPSTDEPLTPNARSVQGRLQVVGLLAATVADVRVGLEVVSGADGLDPQAAPVPLAMVGEDCARIDVMFGDDVGGHRADPEVGAGVDWAASVLGASGSRVSPGLPDELHAAVDLYSELRDTDTLDEIAQVVADRTDEVSPLIRELLGSARRPAERHVVSLWARRDRLRGALLSRFTGDRVLVMPVASTLPPWTHEHRAIDQFALLAPSRAVTLFGLPSLSMPCAVAPDGRPVSVQIVGPPFREDLVLAVGRRLELERRSDRCAGT